MRSNQCLTDAFLISAVLITVPASDQLLLSASRITNKDRSQFNREITNLGSVLQFNPDNLIISQFIDRRTIKNADILFALIDHVEPSLKHDGVGVRND